MAPRVTPDQRRRADAERNLAAIIKAGRECFGRNPSASMTEIAQAAGVGRVTLYGHFSSREELLEAVLHDTLTHAQQAFDAAEPQSGTAADALSRLVRASWQVLDGCLGLRAAAVLTFGESGVRRRHEVMLGRVDALIGRGQDEGDFRTDLPRDWLVATTYGLIHLAADEVAARRLARDDAGRTIEATVRAALAIPHGRG
ncbi:TetR/AcrR family transcriptional regulator [Yinghuangia soli]|uniref:TetR/AcrR family transcriptional regulator n=1 Tax=Yinghuangia soli TaxID=2908204 RepID=A0AA41Q918_9ACTN|nr:TetR/AcrR family transcriptional regulator [Yinghuangia soli]MCF2533150.1 TetR/AcrR family transcriptional regulator [Yinghuangia soli]